MSIHEAARRLRERPSHSSSKKGVVTGLDESDNGMVRVSVRCGPKPRKDKKGMTMGPYPEHASVQVPKDLGLVIGDKLTITTTVGPDRED